MYWIDTSDSGRLMSSDRQIPFWADSERDVPNLPRMGIKGVQQGDDTTSCRPVGKGSTCMCIGDGSGAVMYTLNSNNEWIKM